MNENNHLRIRTEEAQLSTDPEELLARVDIEASAVTIALPWQRFEDVNHRTPSYPFDTIPLPEAMQASLEAHSVINGMFAPSGALYDRIPPRPDHHLVNPTAMRRPAKRANSAGPRQVWSFRSTRRSSRYGRHHVRGAFQRPRRRRPSGKS